MSYRTNRKTGGVFRTDEDVGFDRRRYTCPVCAAMMGQDMPSEVAQSEAKITGHEVAGTPLSSFVSKAELQEHTRRVHPGGKRFPTKQHRAIGRVPQNPASPQETATVGEGSSILDDDNSEDGGLDIVGDVDSDEDILGKESEKQSVFSGGDEEDEGTKGFI